MTDNEVAVRHDGSDSWLDVASPVAKFADYICRTDFVPKAMRGNPAAVTATILTGRELDMGPMTALRSLDVIEGNVQMKTKAILARIFKAGHKVIWLEATDKSCEVRIERGDGLTTAQIRWTMADAQRAELASKACGGATPGRCSATGRSVSVPSSACPDVILGMEAGEDTPAPEASTGYAPTTVQIAQEARQEPITAELVEVVAPEIPEPQSPCAPGRSCGRSGPSSGSGRSPRIGSWTATNDAD